jgi:hypothetical protein
VLAAWSLPWRALLVTAAGRPVPDASVPFLVLTIVWLAGVAGADVLSVDIVDSQPPPLPPPGH